MSSWYVYPRPTCRTQGDVIMKNIITLLIASFVLSGCFTNAASRKNLYFNAPQARSGTPWQLVASTDETTLRASVRLTSPYGTIQNLTGERESTKSILSFDCSDKSIKAFTPRISKPKHEFTVAKVDRDPPINIRLIPSKEIGWLNVSYTFFRDVSFPEKIMNAQEAKVRIRGVTYTYDVSGFTPADCPNRFKP